MFGAGLLRIRSARSDSTGQHRRTRQRARSGVVVLTVAAVVSAFVVASGPPAYAGLPAGVGIDLSQCTNGQANPLDPEPCVGSSVAGISVAIAGINGGASTSYKNWVNGNANGQKAHWREGEFIAYRAALSGLAAGSHTLSFDYQVTDTGKHALD